MKGKAVFTLAIIGALFSLGYSGCEASCDYKSATYKSSAGTTWTVNVHVKQCKYIFHAPTCTHFLLLIAIVSSAICFITAATNQACIEYSYIQHSCSQDSGGCSYPFHGLSICFDEKYSK